MAIGDIEHWVVLMMENRSFDHLFGYLKMENADNLLCAGRYAVDGIDGGDAYPFPSTGVSTDYVTVPDPGHHFGDVSDQIFGVGRPATGAATMRGFVQSYAKPPNNARRPLDVMRCFRPQDIPVLTTLAQSFVLCDRWFASVPSSTWPNRYFMHAATSMGWADLDNAQSCHLFTGEMKFNAPTLFGRVQKAGKQWRIYHHNPPHSATLTELAGTLDRQLDTERHWREFDPGNGQPGFAEDCANDDLPYYTFIEPQFDPCNPNNPLVPDNSGHPTGDFKRAQELIREVYNAVRSNDLWLTTALVIVFDEHGGFYDHVPPPSLPPEVTYAPQSSFQFDRLGPRVPALVISPWVKKGVVDHGPKTGSQPDAAVFYDHTSIAGTLIRLLGGGFLTKRDANAKTLHHLFDNDCRHDCLQSL